MNRKFKALGLALFAALALSAFGAQAASADLFKSPEAKNTIVTSSGQHVKHQFTALGTEVFCEVTNFSGTQEGETATEITITPTYEKCVAFGQNAVVRTNHCGYLFTSKTVAAHEETHAPVHIECENEGEHIEIEVPSFGHCTVTVAPQSSTRGVTYTNLEDGTVTVDITAEVTATRDTNGNFFCELLAHHDPEALYEGASILTGFEDKGTSTTENGTVTFAGDETATTEDRGNTHWNWSVKEGAEVDIEVEST